MNILSRMASKVFGNSPGVSAEGQSSPMEFGGRALWRATHRHKKGGEYRVLGKGILETDRSDVTIYDDADGTIWVRPSKEFFDGRFTELNVHQT